MTDGTPRSRRLSAGRIAPFAVFATATLALAVIGGLWGRVGRLPLPVIVGEIPAGGFIILFLGSWIAGLAVLLVMPRISQGDARRAIFLIIGLSLACRLALLPHPASDDVNRYLWEGRILSEGFSPYTHAAHSTEDPEVDRLRHPEDPYWSGVNHPEMTAIYPPLMELGFAAIASVSYTDTAVKVVMVAFDLVTLLLILALLRERELDPRWALIYGLNPVVLYAFAGQGHLDSVQLCLVMGAVLLYRKKRWGWMWLLLGLAVQVKYVAILGWPLFIRRDNLRSCWLAGVGALSPTLPFLLLDGAGVFESLLAFGHDFAFNGPIHWVFRRLTGSIERGSEIAWGLFAAVWLFGSWWFRPGRRMERFGDPAPGLLFLFGALLLLSPTVHFWYLTWLIPFLCIRPSVAWLALTATIAFSFVPYGLEHQGGEWAYPTWALFAVWAVPLLLMAREVGEFLARLRASRVGNPRPREVAVIVPTRNEAERISECVASLRADPAVSEVIVVDGGSRDRTREAATSAGARVVVHESPIDEGGGRGGQIGAGLRTATADIVAIVHADTTPGAGTFSKMVSLLAANPEIAGGAVGTRFDGAGAKLRILEVANDTRAALFGISFGDQIQFFRRRSIVERQLYPALPLMEDVELGLRLQRLGWTTFLWGEGLVSPRSWKAGSLGRTFLIVSLLAEYLIRRVAGTPDTVPMYRRYYGG